MDERVGVDQLDGAGGAHGVGGITIAGFGGREAEDGTEAFSAGKDRMPHGLVDGGGPGRRAGQEAPESGVHHPPVVLQISPEVRHRED